LTAKESKHFDLFSIIADKLEFWRLPLKKSTAQSGRQLCA